jgi:hypothetical protein
MDGVESDLRKMGIKMENKSVGQKRKGICCDGKRGHIERCSAEEEHQG